MPQLQISRWIGYGLATMAICVAVMGCGPRVDRMRLALKVAPEGPLGATLKKTVAILPMQNRTQVAETSMDTQFRQPVTELLRDRCPQIRFVGPSAGSLPPMLAAMQRTATDGISNQKLLATARANKLTALVGVALADVQVHSEPKGIWIFTYDDFTIEITAEVVVFSPETGAKQLDTHLRVSKDILGLDYHAFRKNPAHPMNAIEDALEDLVDDLADAACKALGEISWFTLVESVDGSTVRLTAGESEGLATGMELHVYNGDAPIAGNDQAQYRIPSQYHGRITIDRTTADQAFATIVDGADAITSGDLAIPVQ